MSSLIPQQDRDYINSVEGQLKATWAKRQVFRTETEIRVSVLNDVSHPTKASKYWQAVREQSVFYENLKLLSFDYRKNAVKIKKATADLAVAADEYEKELLQIKLDKLEFYREQMEQQGRDRIREIKLWDHIMQELDDGSFDTDNPNTHQLVSIGLSLANKLSLGNLTGQEKDNALAVYNTAMGRLDSMGMLERKDEKLLIKGA